MQPRAASRSTKRRSAEIVAAAAKVFAERGYHGASTQDIADVLGIHLGTVKSRVGRARKALRLILAKTYPEFDTEDSPFEWFDHVRPSARQQGICA